MGYVGWRQVWEKKGVQRAAALYLSVDIPAKHPLIPSGSAEGCSPLPGFGAAHPGDAQARPEKTFFLFLAAAGRDAK